MSSSSLRRFLPIKCFIPLEPSAFVHGEFCLIAIGKITKNLWASVPLHVLHIAGYSVYGALMTFN